MSMTIKDFCRLHHACSEGRRWAMQTGEPGMAELWERESRVTFSQLPIYEDYHREQYLAAKPYTPNNQAQFREERA